MSEDMASMNSYTNIGAHLKKVSDTFNEDTSMSEILDQFRVMSAEYQAFTKDMSIRVSTGPADYRIADEDDKLELRGRLQMVDCLVTNSIYDNDGFIYNWNDIYKLLLDPVYKNTQKTYRKVVFSTSGTARPVGEKSFDMWNGLQIIDLDIKDEYIANKLKEYIFNDLCKYHWFLGVCKSASGKGLHVWTKITPITISASKRRIEYLCNYRMKYSYVYIILSKYANELGYTKEQMLEYLDMAMAKPQQGIFISSDDTAKMSVNFYDTRLDVNFEAAFDNGIESINWISHPELKDIFSKLEWFNRDTFNKAQNVKVSNISNINYRDPSKLRRRHYKHTQRWQLANTLTSLYGYDKALELMCEICDGTDARELRGDVKTASIHQKPISIWAVKELNKWHGFNIKLAGVEDPNIDSTKKNAENENIKESPTDVLSSRKDFIKLHINADQYLGDIKDDIISNLSNITLLEAGAGYGKTEMIKALKSKTLLILPFTSTIKAKVETSKVTEDWLYYYGNKRPTLDDILGAKSMSMTIDKFSRLNIMELDAAGFEYIVLDESHLLFTSSYRDVMSPAIQRLANCKAKVILMTGTPTGELLFFPDIRHIKVVKDDVRTKEFKVFMCPTSTEQLVEMCKSMAQDVMDGKKILFPTNKGNLYFEQVTGLIQDELNKKGFKRPLNAFYYKKSNYGDNSMDHINVDKSIGANDIIFCTTYLSVGVDICDRYTFSVYFNEAWIPQDIEQFANRLRNNDLYLKMFLPKKDSDGIPFNYYHTHPLDLSFKNEELLLARDLIKTCNDMIERNNEDAKYNPIIQSLLSVNRYLKYDENDCRYYIDETTYKLKVFEDRYSDYSKQFLVMISGIKYYGYTVEIKDFNEEIDESRKSEVEEYLKAVRHNRFNENTIKTFEFIDHINDGNIDLYKELIKGNYEIFRDDKYKEVRGENNLYVEDIEILERNIPIIVSLYKLYDIPTIRDIYEYCIDGKQNRINFSKLNRIRKFVSIERSRQKHRLDFPVLKFVRESQKWAKETKEATKVEIDKYLQGWAAKYANTITDVVVQDIAYLEQIYNYIKELWSVVVVQDNPKKGKINMKPFELLWSRKITLDNIYSKTATEQFFMQELVDNMKSEDDSSERDKENEEIDTISLPHTRKYNIEDIEGELPHVVGSSFNYHQYSQDDNSNERFLEKQKKQNSLRGTLFEQIADGRQEQSYMQKPKDEQTLFDTDVI